MAATFYAQQIASSWGEPWAFSLFVGLAVAVLAAVHCWMEFLAAWSDDATKTNEILKLASIAISATTVAFGAWYALAFLSLPSDV